jgi:PAS domain S-box-containing protein
MLDKTKIWFEKLILGKVIDLTQKKQKRALLLGQLCILVTIISFVYVIFDLISVMDYYYIVFAILFCVSILTFILNRQGRFNIAAILMVLVGNFVIYVFASSEVNNPSAQLFFILSAVGGLALFSDKKALSYFSVLLPMALFLLTNLFDFSILPRYVLTKEYLKVDYYVNDITSFAGIVLVVVFLIRNNLRTENQLLKNEEELIKIRKRYELAIKGSRAGIWEWDIKSGIVYNSPVWKQMLGYDENELNSMTLEKFLSIVHPDDREITGKAVQAHLSKKEPYLLEFRMLRKDGTILWVLDSGQAVWSEKGEPVQMVGSIMDIGERKEAAEKIIEQNNLLAKANAELDRFVYSASHDLRSPLSSVLGLINLTEKANEPKEVLQYLAMMKNRIKVLDDFIKEIVLYSQNTRLELNFEQLNLRAMVHETAEGLKFAEEAQGLDIQIDCPVDFSVYADARRLSVVLNNLVSNAIKYKDSSKRSQWVKIEVAKIQGGWEIAVKDNGVGIKQEHLPKIFDMFYRASEKSYGSGLGLYIVKETLNKMGASISVESEYEKGSTFKINLMTPPNIVKSIA